MTKMERFKVQAKSFSNDVYFRNSQEVMIERQHSYLSERSSVDVQGNYWALGWAHIPKGRVYFYRDERRVEISGDVILYRAPFSVIRWHLKPGILKWTFLVSSKEMALANQVPSKMISPVAMSTASQEMLHTVNRASGLLVDINIQDHCVNDFKRQIDQSFQSAENIQDLLPPSRNYSYLSREFKKMYGLSPVKYRNHLRLMQSAQDLMMNGKSIEWVYHHNGINDPKYFYSRFKKFFGARPSQFRRT